MAEVCARAGIDVIVCESSQEQAERAQQRRESSLARASRKGKLTHDGIDDLGWDGFTIAAKVRRLA